jgi:hypothetical protein
MDLICLDQRKEKKTDSKAAGDDECVGDGILRADSAHVGAATPVFQATTKTPKAPRRLGWVSAVDSTGAQVVSILLPVGSGEKYFYHWAGYVIAQLMCDRRGGGRYTVLVNDIACMFDTYRNVMDKRADVVHRFLVDTVAAATSDSANDGPAVLRAIFSYNEPYSGIVPEWYTFNLKACMAELNNRALNTNANAILPVDATQVCCSFSSHSFAPAHNSLPLFFYERRVQSSPRIPP